MTLALTAAYAYPELISCPTGKRRGNQIIELQFTAATTDVTLDVGALAGTFWTAVAASARGAAVLAAITRLYPQFSSVGSIAIQSPGLLKRVQSATAGNAGEYDVAIDSTTKMPNIACHTADGDASWSMRIISWLDDGQLGQSWAYPPDPS